MKPILLSGIQPTGQLHLGNYLGALKNFVDLQNSGRYQCYFFIADLHSLTENFRPKEKSRQIFDLLADYLAAGLNPKKATVFVQSDVPAHSELAWLLSTITYFGELGRMTQFKDKAKTQKQNVNIGLFTYPILMTADVLLYDAQYVPVGEDQIQHLEFTRELARRFNKKFGRTFTEPEPLLTETPCLASLTDPAKKMSKSQPQGCLFLDDPPAVIKQKIMSATTDSGKEIKYRPQKKGGVSNLLLIYSSLSGKTISQLEKIFKNKGYAELKKSLAQITADYFQAHRAKKSKIAGNKSLLAQATKLGKRKAGKVAAAKIKTVKEKLGLI